MQKNESPIFVIHYDSDISFAGPVVKNFTNRPIPPPVYFRHTAHIQKFGWLIEENNEILRPRLTIMGINTGDEDPNLELRVAEWYLKNIKTPPLLILSDYDPDFSEDYYFSPLANGALHFQAMIGKILGLRSVNTQQ